MAEAPGQLGLPLAAHQSDPPHHPIIPQSFCSRYGLAAGSKTVDLVRVFMVVLYPVVKPVSMALDKLLGAELGQMYSKGELIQLIRSQARMRADLGTSSLIRSDGADSAASLGERPLGEDEGAQDEGLGEARDRALPLLPL